MAPKQANFLQAQGGRIVRRSNQGWREFMRAHIDWYRQQRTNLHNYNDIWTQLARPDWRALGSNRQQHYNNAIAQGGFVTGLEPPRHGNQFMFPPLRNTAAAVAAPVPAPAHPPPPPAALVPPQPPAVPPLPTVIGPVVQPAPAPPQFQPAPQVSQPAHPLAPPPPLFAQPPPARGYAAPINQNNPLSIPGPIEPGQHQDRVYADNLAEARRLLQAIQPPKVNGNFLGLGVGNVSGLRPPGVPLAFPLPGPIGPGYGAPLLPAPPAPRSYIPRTTAAQDPSNNEWNWNDPGETHFKDHAKKPIPFPTDANDHDSVVEDADRGLWTRASYLGRGTYGSVQLWIKYDKTTGNVLDRVAVKSISYKENERDWMIDAGLWFDGVASRKIPAEAAAMRVLNNELHNLSEDKSTKKSNNEPNDALKDDSADEPNDGPLCPLIVGYRGSRVYPDEKRTFRIAMPVSEFGSLHSWIDNKIKELNRGDKFPDLPPVFIFDFFSASLTAAKFMAKRNMVHNDIKLDNLLIFADDTEKESPMSEFEHDEGDGLGWGIHPVFTDFGLTRPIDCRAIPNPQGVLHMGTPSYMPPEQIIDRARQSLPGRPRHSIVHGQDNEPVNEKAMVFSIAVMIFRLVHPLEGVTQPVFAPHPPIPGAPKATADNLYNTFGDNPGVHSNGRTVEDRTKIDSHFNMRANMVALSKGSGNECYRPLKEILTDCLRFNPKVRLSIDETLAKLKKHRPKDSQDHEFVKNFAPAAWMQFYPLDKSFDPVDLKDTRNYRSINDTSEDEDESEAP